MPLRIVLADANIYESLLAKSALLDLGVDVAAVTSDFTQVQAAITKNDPDVLIISMDADAIKAVVIAEKARSKNPDLGLVFLTHTPDLRLLGISEKELPHGVQVILKSSVIDLHVLTDAIHRSVDDLKSRSKTRWVSGASFTDETAFASVLHALTEVQIETLRLIALGSSNAEIARIRMVTEKAVEHTITRTLQALSIGPNPRHNARVLLSREYYRWVGVADEK